jgi:hypothetical protein
MNRIVLLAFLLTAPILLAQSTSTPRQPTLGHRSAVVITVDGLQFKDLNRNGKLDPTKTGDCPPPSALVSRHGAAIPQRSVDGTPTPHPPQPIPAGHLGQQPAPLIASPRCSQLLRQPQGDTLPFTL